MDNEEPNRIMEDNNFMTHMMPLPSIRIPAIPIDYASSAHLLAALFSCCSWPCVICLVGSVLRPLTSTPSLAQHHSLSACPPFPLSLGPLSHSGKVFLLRASSQDKTGPALKSWNNASGMHLADRADVRHRMHGISCRVGARVDRIPSG